MNTLLLALPFAFIAGGLLVLTYLSTPAARRHRNEWAHARQMRSMRGLLSYRAPDTEPAQH